MVAGLAALSALGLPVLVAARPAALAALLPALAPRVLCLLRALVAALPRLRFTALPPITAADVGPSLTRSTLFRAALAALTGPRASPAFLPAALGITLPGQAAGLPGAEALARRGALLGPSLVGVPVSGVECLGVVLGVL